MTKYECMEWLFSHFDETENNLLSLPCMIEEWKDIEGYEGLYQVSNLGNVKSLKWGKERILNAGKDGGGYYFVYLYNGNGRNGRKMIKIHRLVAMAFIPNPTNLPQVNHKDEDKTNNTVGNLEWCTNNYNLNYGTRLQRQAKTQTNRVDISKPVLCIELNKDFKSAHEAAKWVGGKPHNICNCCNCKKHYNTAYGYHWKYI